MSNAITIAKILKQPHKLSLEEITAFIRTQAAQPATSGALHMIRTNPTLKTLQTIANYTNNLPREKDAEQLEAIHADTSTPTAADIHRIETNIETALAKMDREAKGQLGHAAFTAPARAGR
ncbi:MAG: hypothetical protein COW05_02805 [Gammaproteobacteria bacterium CG12_big_fil_rev_8_21_14_0_65_46_12]|nr:MAG: hypothetical protein COW05_02805 [Gammaproteobacteria bacterium CG12_big_fil_rev_8_21_14_0_65_46_12]PIR31795.1 MAG: hypothetical protein COV36_06810 [Alphaproteobacteria bacterium CG11_big_fil_rev_8_21_14_0_20_44_7]